MTITFRPATVNDSANLMRWRNDPVTVKNFRNSREVSLGEHERWLASRLAGNDWLIFIAEDDRKPIGTVQLDRMLNLDKAFETSVTVAPEARGKGYGGQILKLVCDDFPEATLYTEIKYDNIASMKSFGAAGFVQIGNYGLWTQWRRQPLK